MSASNALRLAVRGIATSTVRRGTRGTVPNNSAYQKVQDMQNFMCKDDGLLVWQKLGLRDRIGYQLTMGLMIMGFIPMGSLLYHMSFPKKKD